MSSTLVLELGPQRWEEWPKLLDGLTPLAPWAVAERAWALRVLVPFDPETLSTALARLEPTLGGVRTRIEPARAAEFGTGFDAVHRATRAGPLWILPPDRSAPPGAQHVLRIDALRAFGAGTHETTGLCLERIVDASPMSSILDVGTGSGILALAALHLGAQRAIGLEIDPDSCVAARANAARNNLALDVRAAHPSTLTERFPLVVANVRTPVLIELAPALVDRVAPGGWLVLSGVRAEEEEELRAAYAAAGHSPAHVERRGEWLRLDLQL